MLDTECSGYESHVCDLTRIYHVFIFIHTEISEASFRSYYDPLTRVNKQLRMDPYEAALVGPCCSFNSRC